MSNTYLNTRKKADELEDPFNRMMAQISIENKKLQLERERDKIYEGLQN